MYIGLGFEGQRRSDMRSRGHRLALGLWQWRTMDVGKGVVVAGAVEGPAGDTADVKLSMPVVSVASSASELACSIRTLLTAACKSAPLSAASICIFHMRGQSVVEESEEVILVSVVVPIVL
jgi:hypothetical protein